MYPNPSADVLNLEWNETSKSVSIALVDVNGKIVDQVLPQDTQRISWLPAVAPGCYQVVVDSEGKRYLSRWMKIN
jgi:hypothetical protein